MIKKLLVYLQYLLPQHFISYLAGRLADSQNLWLKRKLIQRFMTNYNISLSDAIIENPDEFASFNQFFIRQLKPELRPITQKSYEVASPCDGTVAQIGRIRGNRLLQVKQQYFNLETLLGKHASLTSLFEDGAFATLYLAPNNYHRVHMPLAGELTHSFHIRGRLFSVNRITSDIVPNLYARNERRVCIFNTAAGPMAVILVGAMIVGSIHTHEKTHFEKGEELGYFKLGSTVIVLFGKDKAHWSPGLEPDMPIQIGQSIGFF